MSVRRPASRKQRERCSDLKISDYLQDLTFYPTMKYQEVMILAMKNEEKSMKFYRAWAEKADQAARIKNCLPIWLKRRPNINIVWNPSMIRRY